MFRAMIMAISTYSCIPVPAVEWDEKHMRYVLCWFPVVGALIGGVQWIWFWASGQKGAGALLKAAVCTAIPVLVTGGIHMDGFLDTVDAKRSCRPVEERLRILKDPHTGAFALLYGILYLMLAMGLYSELTDQQLPYLAAGYVYSRILSALSVVTLRKAKPDGMLADTARASGRPVKWILWAELFCFAICLLAFGFFHRAGGGLLTAACCLCAGIACFFYYRHVAYRWFGGVTGDLAGYFLQLCELWMLAAIILAGKI